MRITFDILEECPNYLENPTVLDTVVFSELYTFIEERIKLLKHEIDFEETTNKNARTIQYTSF